MNLKAARQILGTAIEMAPRDKIFNRYIEMKLLLGNMDRCRKLYGKYLEWAPANCHAWTKFAEMEKMLGQMECCRGVFELAIAQPALDMPKLLWKAYINFEIAGGELERARQLYERLLDRTKHVKVKISYANFEATACSIEQGIILDCGYVEQQNKERHQRSRQIFDRALSYLRTAAPELKEERAMLLEEWQKMENGFGGGIGDDSVVKKRLPRKIKRMLSITTEDGTPAGCEEYFDYVFPDEESAAPLKFLEAAYKWKKQKQDHLHE